MALETLLYPDDSKGLIHHSDRGCQYCSYSYVNILMSRGIQISMTESGDLLENAVAERVNGIIKSEWLYGVEIKDYTDCYERVSQAIEAYNNLRPHMSLDYQTPTEVHDFGAVPVRHWKTYTERKQANQERALQRAPAMFDRPMAYQACLGRQKRRGNKRNKIKKTLRRRSPSVNLIRF